MNGSKLQWNGSSRNVARDFKGDLWIEQSPTFLSHASPVASVDTAKKNIELETVYYLGIK